MQYGSTYQKNSRIRIYIVESKQKLGYKLTANSELLLPWEITSESKNKDHWKTEHIILIATDSTQNQALKMAEDVTE